MQSPETHIAPGPTSPAHRCRNRTLSLCLALGFILGASGAVSAQENALLAHDINGFALDMTVEQVTSLAKTPLVSLDGDQYGATVDGIDYDFRFSPLGHLYRIDSRQEIGTFTPDDAFAADLTERLAKKFGPPQSNQLPAGPASWLFQEDYIDAGGQKLKRETESLTVLVKGGNGQPVAILFKLTAARILRRDTQK
jgi:hypothetical protein